MLVNGTKHSSAKNFKNLIINLLLVVQSTQNSGLMQFS